MEDNRNCMSRCVSIFIICVVLVSTIASAFYINDIQADVLVTNFKKEIDVHVDQVLAYQKIQDLLEKSEKELWVASINVSELFADIYLNVSVRYNDVVLAANNLKTAIEADDEIGALPLLSHNGPPRVPWQCCCSMTNEKYNGRFRDDVQMSECYGNYDDILQDVAKSKFVQTLKRNFDQYPPITWQYFADKDGHYVQYPANSRACYKMAPPYPANSMACANLTSPLTEEWFVEKLHMELKNLVILMDNSFNASSVIKTAVRRSLRTLTPNDKVNVVVTPTMSASAVLVSDRCADQLFISTPSNIKELENFIVNLQSGFDPPNLLEGLQKVYELFLHEKSDHEVRFQDRSNIVLLLINGQSTPVINETALIEMMVNAQKSLNHSIQHFVYILKNNNSTKLFNILAQIADQNNLKLQYSSSVMARPWSEVSPHINSSVGKEGLLDLVENDEDFVTHVSSYFQRLPPQVDNELTTIIPVLDNKYGVGMTVAVPVYNIHRNMTLGVVAVDASLATVFMDIVNFDTGLNGYMYLVDVTHGHVILHPKLRDPAETYHENVIFPRLELLEPNLKSEEINIILKAQHSPIHKTFTAQMSVIRPTIAGEFDSSNTLGQKHNATVYYQLISGTKLVMVLVHFRSDVTQVMHSSVMVVSKIHLFTLSQKLNSVGGVYHRLDQLFGSPNPGIPGKDAVCHLEQGHFLSFKQSVIKFSPSVFNDPELYKYSDEIQNIRRMQYFITTGNDTGLIKPSIKGLILYTLRATSELDNIWKDNTKVVIERFYGSTSGVFRMYPGAPLMNTFDHRKSDWYQRSVAFPDTIMYHYGKLSFVNSQNVIIISKAVVSTKGILHGVVGMTVTQRFLTSQLLSSAPGCQEKDTQCHIVDTAGNILNSGGLHIGTKYPWLVEKLLSLAILQINWCTDFSDGYHKMTLTLTGNVNFTSGNSESCQQYSLHAVPKTNMFVLVVGKREILSCDQANPICVTLHQASPADVLTDNYDHNDLLLPRCHHCLSNTTAMLCQCFCNNDDLDTCHGQFKIKTPNFPTQACYYSPPNSDQHRPESPSPFHELERCPIQCVAIEDMDICDNLAHCKLSNTSYPTCIWKDDAVNISRFFPTTIQIPPPLPKQTSTAYINPHSGHASLNTSIIPASVTAKPSFISSKSSQAFVTASHENTIVLLVTGSQAYPLTETSLLSSHTGTQTISDVKNSSKDEESKGLSSGAIAAIVIGTLVGTVIVLFIVIKLYGNITRKFSDLSSKYQSSNFDSTLFLQSHDIAINSIIPSVTTVPYQEMS